MASRVVAVILAVLVGASAAAHGSEPWWNETQVYGTNANSGRSTGVFVGLTLIQSAAAKGAGEIFLPQQQNCSFLYSVLLQKRLVFY